ncbi:hypothetical protein GCM10009634_31900 [Saccharothrix xinjiangensis]
MPGRGRAGGHVGGRAAGGAGRLLQPAFHADRFPAYGRTTSGRITAQLDSWHDGQVLDVGAEMAGLTTTVLTATMFSDTLPPARLRQFRRDADALVSTTLPRMLPPPALIRLPIPVNLRFARSRDRLRAGTEEIGGSTPTAGTRTRAPLPRAPRSCPSATGRASASGTGSAWSRRPWPWPPPRPTGASPTRPARRRCAPPRPWCCAPTTCGCAPPGEPRHGDPGTATPARQSRYRDPGAATPAQ